MNRGEKNLIIKRRVNNICIKWSLSYPSKAHTIGRLGEIIAYDYFREKDLIVLPLCLFDSKAKFDFLVNKKKVEVKTSLAHNNNYTAIFAHNRTEGKSNFDYILMVLLADIESPADIFMIKAKHISHLQGINGNSERFNKFPFAHFYK